MGDEYEQLKKCFDLEKIKNSNLMSEITNIKEKLDDNNVEVENPITYIKTKENIQGIYILSTHSTMVNWGLMFCKIIGSIVFSFVPIYSQLLKELFLSQPVPLHISCF